MIAQTNRWQWRCLALVLCTCAGPAWAADAPVTNATLAELRVWFTVMAAVAVVLIGVFWSRGLSWFGALAALVLLGSSARLWLTQPLWFPRLEISADPPENLIMLMILAAQAVLTGVVLVRPAGREAVRGLFARAGTVRLFLLMVLVAVFCLSATPYVAYGYFMAFGLQIGVGGALSLVQMATLVAMFAVAGPDRMPRIPVSALAVFAAVASAVLAWTAFDRAPHVEDELAYLFQARTFAAGTLWAPVPPEAAQPALEYYLLEVHEGKWISVPAQGWAVVLSLGVLIGEPWVINPILTGISVWLAHDIVRHAVSRERADMVALLMATSPWVLAVGATLMNHALMLVTVLLAWWCLLRAGEGSARRAVLLAFAAGLALGWGFFTRPLDGLIVGGLTGLWLLRRLPGGVGQVLACGVGGILSGSAVFLFNYGITGDPLLTAQADYLSRLWPDTQNAFGFGENVGPPAQSWGALDIWVGHSPAEAVLNLINAIASLNLELLGWTFGSLVPIWIGFIWGKKLTGFDRAMLVIFAVLVAVLFFYWFTGTFYLGPRYWHTALLPALVLSAAGIEAIHDRLSGQYRGRLNCVVLLLCAVSVVSFTSWRGVSKYDGYGGYTGDIRRQVEAADLGNALVFVSTEGDIGSALYLNDPFLPEGKPIFLRDMSPQQNAAIIAAFPGREVVYLRDSE
ncbi:glycosyltransferase family 39 protein [Ruegeria sp. 6PALISEP08]|uniref:glycosyltransferase family 39 protein n=1 Tax=Ruegeria sp. 6PALISEP08 TaxID=1225660 RepID=UPI00067E90B6|nr:glycosyltransferase family 39 protein [Ruegeria sp. 6PALISEP08]